MRIKITSFALLATLLWGTPPALLSAQESIEDCRSPQTGAAWSQSIAPSPFASLDDGLDILGAALDTRHGIRERRDCSHLVHAVYKQAGFPYPYSNSRQLYAGIEQFQSVQQPQPGDLVVWRGHVGIVVDPAKGSFFSALRSGGGVAHYDSTYWRRRGRPKFLRYVKDQAALGSRETAGD
jgi:cell wall-associated NlpC family hydrolase